MHYPHSNIMRWLLALILTLTLPSTTMVSAQTRNTKSKTTKTTTQKRSTSAKSSSNKSTSAKSTANKGTAAKGTSKGTAKKGASSKSKGTAAKGSTTKAPTSSAEAKKRQADAKREIERLKAEIKANDAAVAKGVQDLGRLEGEIAESKKAVESATRTVNTIQARIDTLNADIEKNGKELEHLRAEYAKVVKKMQRKKNGNSDLAFIFASKSFSQGMRRMRYLREFSSWRSQQSARISGLVSEMKLEQQKLEHSRKQLEVALRNSQEANAKLQNQYAQQNSVVSELKKNGGALQRHLTKKQAEANQLGAQISSLIAREQAEAARREQERIAAEKREAERKAEAARKAEEERLLAQEKAAQQTQSQEPAKDSKAKDKKTQEKPAKDNKGDLAANSSDLKATPASKSKKEAAPKKNAKDNKAKDTDKGKNSNASYADARKRAPRSTGKSSGNAMSESSKKNQTAAAGGDFAKMRGALPRPVKGEFVITSRFGPHALPDLPDVVYDNPGIDARTAKGASAVAVFEGKVSGVYMIPGYQTVVIVNHGNYYTVYGNIASPGVKVGDKVQQGTTIGRLAAMEEDPDHSQIHFEVWKNRDKLNPGEWIK